MKATFAVVLATLAAFAAAAPLNINLGAYSPALVVGDGAIGFNGAEGEAARNGAAFDTPVITYNRWRIMNLMMRQNIRGFSITIDIYNKVLIV
ncbi:uncharacterized protein GGS22DRAFT_192945 [Annulohypoxylon maeteangense]|uniref:uncharacterized protein n=1 Tax=Annulohypoxylon maeteangense TaxID=1927788 RepID=UPI002007F7C7|nr:uncharacterized protein GGS22DRAFT_192945 [Annulohypoxylon maeteangense]KAI0880808.1 hypothetical protein GGS22DRAFT_192945 [Annulohypoxylon maeteangense]